MFDRVGEKKGLGLDGWVETQREGDTCKHAKEERERKASRKRERFGKIQS